MPNFSEVRWGEDNPIENAPSLTEEEQHALKQRMEAMDKLLADQQKAKYKIELLFPHARSTWKPTVGMLSFWESGARLHGGGDAKIYMCPGKSLGKSTCEAFIPDASNGYGHLVCPACKEVWRGEQAHGEVLARLTMQNWAKLLLKYFVLLGHNADIYVKHAKDDLRAASTLEQARPRGGEVLSKARDKRVTYIYPWARIVKDTASGGDLLRRFHALLTA